MNWYFGIWHNLRRSYLLAGGFFVTEVLLAVVPLGVFFTVVFLAVVPLGVFFTVVRLTVVPWGQG